MASATKSLIQTLRRYMKKPLEIIGPYVYPEYKDVVSKATEYRFFCPATILVKAIIPTSDPKIVHDIKYFSHGQRRNRPPIRRTVLKKSDIEKMMKEMTFDINDFPKPYLTYTIEKDLDAISEGYQK